MKVFTPSALCLSSILVAGCSSDDPANSVDIDILSGQTYARCDGAGSKVTYAFDNGSVTKTTETFAAGDCSGAAQTTMADALTYQNGNTLTDNDGNEVLGFNLTENGTTLYTIRRLSGGTLGLSNLNFGSTADSDTGRDGSTEALRHNGLNDTETFELQ